MSNTQANESSAFLESNLIWKSMEVKKALIFFCLFGRTQNMWRYMYESV